MAPTTRHFYQKCWDKFSHFVCQIIGATLNFPVQSKFVSQYVAYLYTQDFAPATISSHLSAISFFHSIAGHSDPCNTDIIRRMTAGCRKLRTQHDNRLPLLLPHIQSLVHATFHILSGSPYQQAMYQSIILLAFFGFFRIGELLPATPSKNDSVVQLGHITLQSKAIHIELHYYKTKKSDKPVKIIIQAQNSTCPVKALKAYLKMRGSTPGPLFISSISEPITQNAFRTTFKTLLSFCQLPTTKYKLHSFRISACTQAVLAGVPEQQIMLMGRWRSNAFRRYIRVPNIGLNPIRS